MDPKNSIGQSLGNALTSIKTHGGKALDKTFQAAARFLKWTVTPFNFIASYLPGRSKSYDLQKPSSSEPDILLSTRRIDVAEEPINPIVSKATNSTESDQKTTDDNQLENAGNTTSVSLDDIILESDDDEDTLVNDDSFLESGDEDTLVATEDTAPINDDDGTLKSADDTMEDIDFEPPKLDMELSFLIPMMDKALQEIRSPDAIADSDSGEESDEEINDTTPLLTPKQIFPEPAPSFLEQMKTNASQDIELPEEITELLQKGLATTKSDDMPRLLGEYVVAVGRFVQQQGELSKPQQNLLRQGYIELLAHDQELKNFLNYTQKMIGIKGGKRALASRIDMLEQIRDAIRVGGQTMATQISGTARLGTFMASQIDMLGCESQKELRDLVFGKGLNIDLYCISGAKTDIAETGAKVKKKYDQLFAELEKKAQERNSDAIIKLKDSIDEGEAFITNIRTELQQKEREFANNNTRHLDQLFLDVATTLEQKRRERLPDAMNEAISETRGHKNKKKYQNPEKFVASATSDLKTGAEAKILGHAANPHEDWSEQEKQKKIEAELKERTQKLWCGHNELLLQNYGLEKFLTLPHLEEMTDTDRSILRDHLLRNLPVNIPLQYKERLFTVAQNAGIVSTGTECSTQAFAKDLEIVTSPLQPEFMKELAVLDPEAFSYLLDAIDYDQLNPAQLNAIYQGCQLLLVSPAVSDLMAQQNTMGKKHAANKEVLPTLPPELFAEAELTLKAYLRIIPNEEGADKVTLGNGETVPTQVQYALFDHANPAHQLMQVLTVGNYVMAGIQASAIANPDARDAFIDTIAQLSPAKRLAMAYGQEALLVDQPQLVEPDGAATRLLLCKDGLPGKCIVNSDSYQLRGGRYMTTLLGK